MSQRGVSCPTCGRELEWAAAPFRPFCSDRCRLIDLGAWLSEQRSIPGDAVASSEDSSPTGPPEKPLRS